ncbi:MAG TPA: serine protease [Rhizobiales bacterium]|nr:serine protease [Hyphomicrobiales bacterium]
MTIAVKFSQRFSSGVIPVVALALLTSACATSTNLSTGPRTVNIESGATPAAAILSSSMNSLLQQTSPSYLTVIVNEKASSSGAQDRDEIPKALTSGSGFVVDAAGYLLTAGHVAVKAGNTVDARGSEGRVYRGKVVAIQRSPDIALIKLNNFSGIPVSPASSPCIRSGTALFSLGKPRAQGDTARIGQLKSMSFGRPVTYSGFGYPDAMVLTMSTRKGESGGPLFNKQAKLSGMMVSTLSDGKGRSLNLAHALPVDMLAKFACSKFSCSPAWRRLAASSYKSCKS